jgi:polyisoprenoid-binding protein YceI
MTGRWVMVALAGAVLAGCQQAPDKAQEAAPTAAAAVAGKAWSVASDASRVSFVSVKSGEIAEVHHFGSVTGTVAPDGTATVSIPLASVETGIDIRNERMRDMLFQVAQFPAARVSAKIDLAAFQDLAVGQQRRLPLSGELDLHGVKAPFEAQVAVTRAAPDRVLVASVDPVVVEAELFKLGEGVEALRKVAGLPAITPAAPVTFQLMFQAAS